MIAEQGELFMDKQTVTRDAQSVEVHARQACRFRILRLIHSLAEGGTGYERSIHLVRLAEAEGVNDYSQTMRDALAYLAGEKLIGWPDESDRLWLTHSGLVEVEKAILDPESGTKHFDASVTRAYAQAQAAKEQRQRRG
jgi:hypothetical protein